MLVPDLIIFSVAQHESDLTDWLNHKATRSHLRRLGVPFTEVYGRYNGETEHGFKVSWLNDQLARTVARKYNQESVLRVYKEGSAYFEYLDGRPDDKQYIGEWERVLTVPPGFDFTHHPSDGSNYIIV